MSIVKVPAENMKRYKANSQDTLPYILLRFYILTNEMYLYYVILIDIKICRNKDGYERVWFLKRHAYFYQ